MVPAPNTSREHSKQYEVVCENKSQIDPFNSKAACVMFQRVFGGYYIFPEKPY